MNCLTSTVRRKVIFLMSSIPIFFQHANAALDINTVPCTFPFDASRIGISLRKEFVVNEYRNYQFVLDFLHNGGEQAKKLSNLLDAEFALFLSDGVNPAVRITEDYFMERKQFASIHDRNEALTEATKKYDLAFRDALFSKGSRFSWRPQKTIGVIPLSIKVSKIDSLGNSVLISSDTLDTLGTLSGGSGRLTREATVKALRPGKYEFQVETVRDSPLFFDTSIEFGITFDSRFSTIKN